MMRIMLISWSGYTNSQEILRFVISVRELCTHMYIRNVTISDTVNQSVYYNIIILMFINNYVYTKGHSCTPLPQILFITLYSIE